MQKTNLKEKELRANLKAVVSNPIKTTGYNDINLKQWKDYSDVRTDIKGGGSDELIKFGMYHSPVGEPVRTIPTETVGN